MGALATDRNARYLEMVSPERADDTLSELQQRMADGEHLPAICKAWGIPYSRVLGWLMADAGRYAVYQRALEIAAHALVAETVAIADGSPPEDTPKARHQTDVRFRVAKHHAAKVYGESDTVGKVLPQVNIAIGVRVGEQAKVIGSDEDI
jgi:hypothetical protein